jgi:hypothetical protein
MVDNKQDREFSEATSARVGVFSLTARFHAATTTCLALLEQLVVERFLRRTHDGTYIAFASVRPKPAKAALPATRPTGADARRRA